MIRCLVLTELFESVLAAPVLRTFVQYLIAFCSRPKGPGDVISGRSVELINVKFRDPRLSCSGEIRPRVMRDGIFANVFAITSKVVSDVIFGVAVNYFGSDVCVKFGDSWSNRSRDIR